MDKTTLMHFKGVLEQQLADLEASAKLAVHDLLDATGDRAIEYLDLAEAETGRAYAMHIRSRESRLMGKILEALDSIADGTFGVCEACGEEIGLARLQARPVTRYCIECKTAMELFERASGR